MGLASADEIAKGVALAESCGIALLLSSVHFHPVAVLALADAPARLQPSVLGLFGGGHGCPSDGFEDQLRD